MEAALAALAAWFEGVGVGPWARSSGLIYPIVNTLHLLGLVMLIGGIGVVDLRLAGLWRALPIDTLSRALTPVAVAGLLILVPSGLVLFAADGRALAHSGVFHIKLVLIALALANAAVFRLRMRRGTAQSDAMTRVTAIVSLALWLAVGTMGRMIAYS